MSCDINYEYKTLYFLLNAILLHLGQMRISLYFKSGTNEILAI